MNVVLELKPETERRIAGEAAARGISVEAYLVSLIEGTAPVVPGERTTLDELEADMDALSEGSEALPLLPAEAFSRESIYADHD